MSLKSFDFPFGILIQILMAILSMILELYDEGFEALFESIYWNHMHFLWNPYGNLNGNCMFEIEKCHKEYHDLASRL